MASVRIYVLLRDFLKKKTPSSSTIPKGPNPGESKVATLLVYVFVTSRAAWISSFRQITVPHPSEYLDAATSTEENTFLGPSVPSSLIFLMAAVKMIGFLVFTVRSSIYAVS